MTEIKERGLWVGLPLPKLAGDNRILDILPMDSHITLLHLGRTNSIDYVNRVERSCRSVAKCPAKLADITGVGWFWRGTYPSVPVALVNSAEMFDLRATLMAKFDVDDIKYDTRYGFIPHVTLNKDLTDPRDLGQYFERNSSLKFLFEKVELVWGDTHIQVS